MIRDSYLLSLKSPPSLNSSPNPEYNTPMRLTKYILTILTLIPIFLSSPPQAHAGDCEINVDILHRDGTTDDYQVHDYNTDNNATIGEVDIEAGSLVNLNFWRSKDDDQVYNFVLTQTTKNSKDIIIEAGDIRGGSGNSRTIQISRIEPMNNYRGEGNEAGEWHLPEFKFRIFIKQGLTDGFIDSYGFGPADSLNDKLNPDKLQCGLDITTTLNKTKFPIEGQCCSNNEELLGGRCFPRPLFEDDGNLISIFFANAGQALNGFQFFGEFFSTSDSADACYQLEDGILYSGFGDNIALNFCNQTKRINQSSCRACANRGGYWSGIGCIPISIDLLVASLLSLAVTIAGGSALLITLYGAFTITTSTGNPERLKNGQEMITAAITGLLFIIFSVAILQFIGIQILQIPDFFTAP